MFLLVHMGRLRGLANMALMSCLAIPAFVLAQTTINFDDVADATDIRTHYQSRGVVFSCDGTPCANPQIANGIFARLTTQTASAPNSVTPVRTGIPGVKDTLTGRVIAAFTSPVKSVSIDARSIQVPEPLNQRHFANMTAFDAAGAVVATAEGSQFGAFQTLTVTAADSRIVKVSLGVTGPTSIALFDNLQFSGDSQKMSFVVMAILFVFILVIVSRFIKAKKDLPRPPTQG